jgi:predicted NAD/FAD-binding protein
VIVGAGAAGVFTAYRLKSMYGDLFDVELHEAKDRVGGNTLSVPRTVGGREYSIDAGAQFFYKNPQVSYVELLEDLGLFDDDDKAEIIEAPAGFTIWDKNEGQHLFHVPSELTGFVHYGLDDWERMAQFIAYLGYSFFLDAEDGSWTKSVDDWLDDCHLLSNEFKDAVVRNFMYQFVTLGPDEIGSASARYATTYFARNAFGEPKVSEPDPHAPDLPGVPTFETYQSLIGLDGILKAALAAVDVTPVLNSPVASVKRLDGGGVEVATPNGTISADHVVLACDPQTSADILEAGGGPAHLVKTLRKMKYVPLPISMQQGKPCQMPTDTDLWEPVNTIVDGENIMFTAWFGPLRRKDTDGEAIHVFKSWGTPNLDPLPVNCPSQFFLNEHYVVQPTTDFMAARDELEPHQGTDGIWFAGGWTNWFDSQEAALDSATSIAEHITEVDRAPGTGTERMASVDHDRHRRHLHRFAQRVARRAPDAEKKKKLERAIHEVEHAG